MPAIARHDDPYGGTIIAIATKTRVNGELVVRIGDAVADPGDPPHDNATIAVGSTRVLVEGVGVCRVGDTATCGHQITAAITETNAE